MKVVEGSYAVAEAVRVCKPHVVSAYPITPQTHIVETLSQMVADGAMKAEYVRVESEFSAISVCIGASAAGARTYTATTSQGLALMHEVLFNAAGMRLPIVMTAVNRSLSAPLSIWNDQQDTISQRDTGWIQLHAENAQEAADTIIQAYKIAEDRSILLPVMVCMDGYILTHVYEPLELWEQKKVDAFLPEFNHVHVLDPQNPKTFGAFADPSLYMEFRYMIQEAMGVAEKKIEGVANEFRDEFGRYYGGLIDGYKAKDADILILAMGSVIGTIKDAIDEMRADNVPVGLLKIRAYRPFPADAIRDAVADAKAIIVLDKNISMGYEGALFTDVKAALYGESDITVLGFVLGLGGRDITKQTIKDMVAKAQKATKSGKRCEFADLRKEVL